MGKSASEVRADIEGTRRDMSETIDAIADRTSPPRMIRRRRRRMAAGVHSMRERVMGRAEDTYRSAGEQAGGMAEQARGVADQARQAPGRVAEQAQGNPVAAGLIAFGGGLLLASLIPPSEPEQRLAGKLAEQTQPLQDELRQAGRQVAEDVKGTARESAEQVKQRASDAAGSVQEDARSSAEQVQSDARR